MSHLPDRVRQYAARHSLWAQGTRVIAAVSGGSDSVALALLLRDLSTRGDIVLAAIAHLHHHIRGVDADADAAFCRALADRLEVPAVIGDADVPAEASEHHVSIEVAGRHARQRFFREALASMKADRIAVAHTRDDQAETVLLRLTRGAGTAGLGGMAPRRDHVIRPVLDLTRTELQAFLRAGGETWREDATNRDVTIPRNLIRHEVMPRLRELNAQADAALARAAELLRGDEEFLERLANAAFLRSVEVNEERETVTADRDEFVKLPTALARRVARYALQTANPSGSYGLEEVDATVERFRAGDVLLSSEEHGVHGSRPFEDSTELRLDIPGTVEARRGAWTVTAAGPAAKPDTIPSDDLSVAVDASQLGSHLIVRYRRPGDRLHPLGAPGRKKVQDVLVDRKVPRDDRDLVPIVTTETGEIVWIAGQVLADRFRVTPLTTSVVVLTLRR
jgi:tRNA(Ile)-lysidine synthase